MVLPLKSIRDDDVMIYGKSIVNLAKLYHLGLPVSEGIAVSPPEIILNTVIQKFEIKNKEIFEQRLELIRSHIQSVSLPEDLEKILIHKNIDSKKIWIQLLNIWIEEIRSKIWREGFSPNLTHNLTPQCVFFTKNIKASGKAYIDQLFKKIVIKVFEGEFDDKLKQKLEEIVISGNKKLIIDQNYFWILDDHNNIEIVKLSPYTPDLLDNNTNVKNIIFDNYESKHFINKSAIKVFQEIDENFILENVDGVILKSNNNLDSDKNILQLVETAISLGNRPLLYEAPNLEDKDSNISGALYLIHHKNVLDLYVKSFLFARNKNNLLNVSVLLPKVKSYGELTQFKRELASKDITRKGSLKIWFLASVPENILNLESYIEAGIDGVVIDLDSIASNLQGFANVTDKSPFYGKQVDLVLKILDDAVKLLQKLKIPVIFRGELAILDEAIEFIARKGLYSLAVPHTYTYLKDHLNFVEKRMIRNLN